jgi:hypothetical protein
MPMLRQASPAADLSTRWEQVDRSAGWATGGQLHVSTWRLRVPGGWLYKVAEWDEDRWHNVQLCFVPQPFSGANDERAPQVEPPAGATASRAG